MPSQILTDDALLAALKTYLANHKYVTRGELRRKLNTSVDRIERLAKTAGITLPPKLSRSAGATLGRKKSNTCAGWYIRHPTPWHQSKSTTTERITP